mgnify:CR=1 FL=1
MAKKIQNLLLIRLVPALVMMLFSGLVLSGCHSGTKNEKYILEEDKMVDVMVDVHMAEAVLRNKRISGDELDKLTSDYYSKIFSKHEITQQQFDSSIVYYEDHIKDFNEIYEKVIVRLNKKQRKAEQAKKEKLEEKQESKNSD